MSDSQGLQAAYASSLGSVQSPDGETMYIAGTRLTGAGLRQAVSDVADDMALPMTSVIPVIGGVRNTRKYHDMSQVIKRYPKTKVLVGHSLGAAVSKQLAREHGLKYRIYNSPSVTLGRQDHHGVSYSDPLDPISAFDRSAKRKRRGWNPHRSYV